MWGSYLFSLSRITDKNRMYHDVVQKLSAANVLWRSLETRMTDWVTNITIANAWGLGLVMHVLYSSPIGLNLRSRLRQRSLKTLQAFAQPSKKEEGTWRPPSVSNPWPAIYQTKGTYQLSQLYVCYLLNGGSIQQSNRYFQLSHLRLKKVCCIF